MCDSTGDRLVHVLDLGLLTDKLLLWVYGVCTKVKRCSSEASCVAPRFIFKLMPCRVNH